MSHTGQIKLPNAANCMECNNCVNSCSHGAIQLKYDFWGRPYPYIDTDVCVACRLCERNCPENTKTDVVRVASKECYAVIANKDILEESSSGGFATVLSQYIINHGGIVVGAAFDSFPRCRHIIADRIEDLACLQKSKYVYSHLDSVLCEIRTIIKNEPDRRIIFLGVPCQIAAAKKFLKKDSNILYVEILCHGTMPDFVFPKYIKGIEKKYKLQVINYLFKGDKKNKGYLVYHKPQIIDKGGTGMELTKWDKWFLVSFLEGYAYKTKCYHCNYVGSERIGDITIGDFWGLGNERPFNYSQKEGVSVVLLNTEKGISAFRGIRHLFDVVEERPVSEPKIQNQTLKQATKVPVGNTAYHLMLKITPGMLLLSFHKIRFYWLRISRAISWRLKIILKQVKHEKN